MTKQGCWSTCIEVLCLLPCVAGEEITYDDVRYTRCYNNPSQEVVAAKIAQLEGMKQLCPVFRSLLLLLMGCSVVLSNIGSSF